MIDARFFLLNHVTYEGDITRATVWGIRRFDAHGDGWTFFTANEVHHFPCRITDGIDHAFIFSGYADD